MRPRSPASGQGWGSFAQNCSASSPAGLASRSAPSPSAARGGHFSRADCQKGCGSWARPGQACLHASWARWPFPPAELFAGGTDVVHGTNFVVPPAWRAATLVTVHDLSPLHYPEWSRPAARRYPELVKAAVRRGAWVHTDSEFVAGEVRELLGVPAERVRAVHPGGPARRGRAGEARVKLPAWAERYVLALGTVEPRKAMPALVRAFGRVAGRHPGTALVIAGPEGPGSEQLARAIAASPAHERVVRLGWVSPADRDALLRGATVFAYPSIYEGFGLPPLEAMAVGTPVVAASAGALPEVLGEAAFWVPPRDEEALASALGHLLSDTSAREDLARKGRARAGLYSWERCAEEIACLYQQVAS